MAVMDKDYEDAICRRTRARYSLAGFSLDELETFLQETDDEDDIQNVDDEEEYRKFLAAVLQGVEGSSIKPQENENVEDEDEDNDADFELEIEEALESDLDENLKGDNVECEAIEQRPKTRLSRRRKSSNKHKKKVSEALSRPLRPILPYSPIPSCAPIAGRGLVHSPIPPLGVRSPTHELIINGFTPYQIGQLHSLIHEHVQLLIQTFSICVLDPVRQHIASDVQKLISELLCKRNEMLGQVRAPYPQLCFTPNYIHSSIASEVPYTSPSSGQLVHSSIEQDGCSQTPQGSSWMPYVGEKTISVLDVAPLKLIGKFVDDVLNVVQEGKRRSLGATDEDNAENVPLFPACNRQQSAETNCHALSSSTASKKTLAASLVERAKKQSIALVPKQIAMLAKQFYPLFNPVLYPHKAPPAAVVNRVLFTDAEDKLLALGLMEYNTDWKAIQQRFLPCKSKHQIFVRQKNRSSSKAPENPIKAVRRMKNSPLTAEEFARIEEGLKVFKLDWMSVWKFIVPYRDPSLLPRQWRIAAGTQKSYRSDAITKEKRRLHDSQKRKCQAATLGSLHPPSQKLDDAADKNIEEQSNADDDCTDKDGEAYVHEAFLADTSADIPTICAKASFPDVVVGESCPYPQQVVASEVGRGANENGCRDHLPQIINRPSSTEVAYMRPYRARKSSTARLVRLAPELPPVNLPPTARVMSRSDSKTYQNALPHTKVSASAKVANAAIEVGSNTANNTRTQLHVDPEAIRERHVAEEKDGPDLQMHPLLFRAAKDCSSLYCPVNSGPDANSSPQLNLSFCRQTNNSFNFLNKALKPIGKVSTSSGLSFHPLLQRTTDGNSVVQPSASSDLPRERLTQPIANCNEQPDLEMHWSLSSKKQTTFGRSVTRLSKSNFETEVNSRSTLNRISSGLDSSAQLIGTSYETDMVDNVDDILGQGIVMEQEELSDSDEEEENVEFECEEMTDSEGEEVIPQPMQITGGQAKERGRVSSDEENSDEDAPPVTRGISIANFCNPSNDTVMTQPGPSSSSLDLNSFPPVSRKTHPKDDTTRHSVGSACKVQKPSVGSRKPGVNLKTEKKPAAGNKRKELNSVSFISPPKQPRRRARNTDSISEVGHSKKGIGSGKESSKKDNGVEIT
ncbi:unnamed protein product [Cuscuta epithymum]|uniref:Homeodomain-like superfamily protein n=2 Tax=Cuscuta epithymum TaxID=186058 RepID=A0AAV0C3D8_9ASTE|nr:unnamed protein product [Cuscuta epithymum]